MLELIQNLTTKEIIIIVFIVINISTLARIAFLNSKLKLQKDFKVKYDNVLEEYHEVAQENVKLENVNTQLRSQEELSKKSILELQDSIKEYKEDASHIEDKYNNLLKECRLVSDQLKITDGKIAKLLEDKNKLSEKNCRLQDKVEELEDSNSNSINVIQVALDEAEGIIEICEVEIKRLKEELKKANRAKDQSNYINRKLRREIKELKANSVTEYRENK